MAPIPLDVAGYLIAIVLGVGAMLFGGRALMILRSGPTGEAARELVFLTGRDLIPAIGLVLLVLVIEWVGWIVGGLNAWGVVRLPAFEMYANLTQAILLVIAGILAFRVLVPYTRARRTERTRVMLDRLAARVALLRGRE